MAVRFRRGGVTEIKNHNELINRGNRTHAEIDSYMAELDVARSSHSSINARFGVIETKNTQQDNRLTAIETKNTQQDQRLTQVENKNVIQDTQIAALNVSVTGLSDGQVVQDQRLTQLENENTSQEEQLLLLSDSQLAQDQRLDELEKTGGGGNPQEVIDARKDKNGIVYSTLKERLDAQQGVGGGTGGGSALPSSGYFFQIENNTIPDRKTIVIQAAYAVGKNEIEVFRGGVRQIKDVHYTESTMLSITFIEALLPGEVVIIRRRDREGAHTPIHLTSEYVITANKQKTFTLTNAFNSPYKSLEVFYNGALLAENEEYTTSLDNKVTLEFEPVIGSLFLFQVVDKKKLPEPFLLEEHQSVVVGKVTYQLTTFSYEEGQLEVYVQGVRWYVNADYTEIDNQTVTFTSPLPPNGQISFVKENSVKLVEQEDLNSIEQRVEQLESKPSGNIAVSQFEISNVTAASTVNPSTQVINIPADIDHKSVPINVLLFKEGSKAVPHNVSDYSNGTNFIATDEVFFDGKMQLKTVTENEMIMESDLGGYQYILSATFDRTTYKKLQSLEVI
ncbi:hypothetical protein ACPA0F_18165 [Solibacillus silvestris]